MTPQMLTVFELLFIKPQQLRTGIAVLFFRSFKAGLYLQRMNVRPVAKV
jgi:hypothetical protein